MTDTQNTQSKVQHTPGPWHTNGGNIYAQRNPGGIRTSICEVFRDAGYDACRANARLIAAAPELLAALERVADELAGIITVAVTDGQLDRVPSLKAARAIALTAIQKARGQ